MDQQHTKIKENNTYTEAISTTMDTVCRSSSHRVGLCPNGLERSPEENHGNLNKNRTVFHFFSPNGVFIDPESKQQQQEKSDSLIKTLPIISFILFVQFSMLTTKRKTIN